MYGTLGTGVQQQGLVLFIASKQAAAINVTVTVSDGKLSTNDSTVVNLRPGDSPDVVVLGFAGRCGPPGCGAPFGNKAYLSEEDQPLQTIGDAFYDLGYSVRGYSFAAIVSQQYRKTNSAGYYEAQQLLNEVRDTWVTGFDNPTRLVLLAHSHGKVWASLLAMENPQLTFDYFLYLDGVCNSWERDNLNYNRYRNIIKDFYNEIGDPIQQHLQAWAVLVMFILSVARRCT